MKFETTTELLDAINKYFELELNITSTKEDMFAKMNKDPLNIRPSDFENFRIVAGIGLTFEDLLNRLKMGTLISGIKYTLNMEIKGVGKRLMSYAVLTWDPIIVVAMTRYRNILNEMVKDLELELEHEPVSQI